MSTPEDRESSSNLRPGHGNGGGRGLWLTLTLIGLLLAYPLSTPVAYVIVRHTGAYGWWHGPGKRIYGPWTNFMLKLPVPVKAAYGSYCEWWY